MTAHFVRGQDDLLALLDELVSPADTLKWTQFYEDRSRPCPFFVDKPDYTLVDYVNKYFTIPGRALDVGCGAGRNAMFLARAGFKTVGIDISPSALTWARERSVSAKVDAQFIEMSFLHTPRNHLDGAFDLVHDAGCFHHLPPHRRETCKQSLLQLVAPDGLFSLTCFSPNGGSGLSDIDVYRGQSLKGGLGYTTEQLSLVFGPELVSVEACTMAEQEASSEYFGKDFLVSMLFRRK